MKSTADGGARYSTLTLFLPGILRPMDRPAAALRYVELATGKDRFGAALDGVGPTQLLNADKP